MKKLMLIGVLLISTLTFAHEKTYEEKKEMYDVIRKQLDEGKIDIKTAQKMWKSYIRCCK
jgi:hypothetical protein